MQCCRRQDTFDRVLSSNSCKHKASRILPVEKSGENVVTGFKQSHPGTDTLDNVTTIIAFRLALSSGLVFNMKTKLNTKNLVSLIRTSLKFYFPRKVSIANSTPFFLQEDLSFQPNLV